MKPDYEQLRQDLHRIYREEHDALEQQAIERLLDEGRLWNLAPTLEAGGVLVFAHAGVGDCGHQTAAAIHACLDSGAERVLLVCVLHALSEEMEEARVRVAQGGDLGKEPLRGIQGPGLLGRDEWRWDHSLYTFDLLWEAELARRGIEGPELIVRYPYLAGGRPETLPGIDELVEISRDAVVISTADSFHHGISYGDPPEKALYPAEGGLALARSRIQEGIDLLARGDHWGYNLHCVSAKSDARDAGQVFRYLRGPMTGTILDLTYTDTTDLYNAPAPSWVAAAMVEWAPLRH
jgi:hypothetical protein